jgi:hypothetical protein
MKVTNWSRVLPEELPDHSASQILVFYGTKEQPVTSSCHVPDDSTVHPHTQFH